MYMPLGQAPLKSGERMEIGVVCAPDPDWAPQITSFLGHKGDAWLPQIAAALAGPLDSLATRFYIGRIEGRLVCQTMLVGDRGVGLVGHVFTRPEDRRKGAIHALLGALMADGRRTFQVLTLGTEFDSPAYRIYHGLGFRSIGRGRGEMLWHGADTDTTFAPAPASVRPVRWDDWAFFTLLAAQPVAPDEDLPRSPLLGLKAQGSVEGAFLTLQARRESEPRFQAGALVAETGATVGWALCGSDPSWFGDAAQLNLYVHPDHTGWLGDLLAALEWPACPVVSYLTQSGGAKAAALHAAGFRQAARLPAWLDFEGRRDILVMIRPGG